MVQAVICYMFEVAASLSLTFSAEVYVNSLVKSILLFGSFVLYRVLIHCI